MKLRLLIVGAALTATTAASLAQDYPARPIRLILGFAPGGSTDLVARVVGQKMARRGHSRSSSTIVPVPTA